MTKTSSADTGINHFQAQLPYEMRHLLKIVPGPGQVLIRFMLLAMLGLRLLVPSGYMPQAEGSLLINVAICSGLDNERATITIDRDNPDGRGDHEPCPFAVAAMAADLPPTLAMPLHAWPTEAPAPASGAMPAPGRGLAAPPPPATGPPLTF